MYNKKKGWRRAVSFSVEQKKDSFFAKRVLQYNLINYELCYIQQNDIFFGTILGMETDEGRQGN